MCKSTQIDLTSCTAYGFLDHSLKENCATITISFQGAQYLSKAYITMLEEHGVEISAAQRGRSWETRYAERLIRTLKEEKVDINDYQNITDARDRIGHFIEQVYHQKRHIRR